MTPTVFVCGKCGATATDTTGWQIVSGDGLGEMIIRCPEHRGPGRPKLDASDPTERFTVTLPASVAAKAAELGNGNLSAGVRQAIEAAKE